MYIIVTDLIHTQIYLIHNFDQIQYIAKSKDLKNFLVVGSGSFVDGKGFVIDGEG